MKRARPTAVRPSASPPDVNAELRARLAEAEETLHAIHTGGVDALMVAGRQGEQVFTLAGAEHAYRVLIESMNEGALTLTADAVILYANQSFARMVNQPLEQVIGTSFSRYLSHGDRTALRPLLKLAGKSGSKIQVLLKGEGATDMPVQISLRPLVKVGSNRASIGMVVTDMTEARRIEELLRALTHRVVLVQEAERGRVALELHDNITQLLCAVHFRSQALVNKLAGQSRSIKDAAVELREMLGKVADEVQRISHNLRPSVLDQLGLVAILQDTGTEFARRTGIAVRLDCMDLAERLPAETELTLFRIFQEAMGNVEKHARASHVAVCLSQPGAFTQFVINDDGIGFDPERPPAGRSGKGGLGLLSMSERATYVGGILKIKSVRRVGTEIEVRIPLPPKDMTAN